VCWKWCRKKNNKLTINSSFSVSKDNTNDKFADQILKTNNKKELTQTWRELFSKINGRI
jgi:hypothetical protein